MRSRSVQGPVRNAVRSHGSTLPLRFVADVSASPSRQACVAAGHRPKLKHKKSLRCRMSSVWLFSTFSPARAPPMNERYEKVPVGGFARRARNSTPCSDASKNQSTDTDKSCDSDPDLAAKSHHHGSSSSANQAPRPPRPPRPVKVFREFLKNEEVWDPALQPNKDVLLSLVSGPVDGTAEQHYQALRDGVRRRFAPPNGQRDRFSDTKQDTSYPLLENLRPASSETQAKLVKLCDAIVRRVRRPHTISLDDIYALYQELPEPRMIFLRSLWRNLLLKIMGLPPKRNSESMLRYFSLVADVKKSGLTLTKQQWNYALALATKYTASVGPRQLKSAMQLWWEMEHQGQNAANEVTFNILFDVATKAGSFTLAETIYREMEERGIPFNHYHHVTLMYHFGLQRDSAGIRAVYREMVEAGELIDTTALNCVITGFLKCGEEPAAEDTYLRMRSAGKLHPHQPEKTTLVAKAITKALLMLTGVVKRYPGLKQSNQRGLSTAPNLRTVKIFIQHYAVRVGNLGKVAYFLNEMDAQGLFLHPTIFLSIFKGFSNWGGSPGNDWSEECLDSLVRTLYQAQDILGREFCIDAWVVIWMLKAIKQCCSQTKLREAFNIVSTRWNVEPDRQAEVATICERIVGRPKELAIWRVHASFNQRRKMFNQYDL